MILRTGYDLIMIKIESPNNSGNFIVTPFTLAGDKISTMVNRIGSYDGWQVAPDLEALEIVSDSDWKIMVYEWSVERMIERELIMSSGESFSGIGDSVVLFGPNPDNGGYTNELIKLSLSHKGKGNFVVRWIVFGENVDLVANEIGNYEGAVLVNDTAAMVAIEAEGEWVLDTSDD